MSETKEVPIVGERVVFRKNGRDFLVIAESEYQGRKYIDIRSHYVNDSGDLHQPVRASPSHLLN